VPAKAGWEVELGVVIGSRAKHLTEERALEFVAGTCVAHDLSERAFQLEHRRDKGQWSKSEGYVTFGRIRSWLVTKDELPGPQELHLRLEVDGVREQDGNTSTMVDGAGFLASCISRFMSFSPGDVISTGTPAGVGMARHPPGFPRAGQDAVRLGIDGLGVQTRKVLAEPWGFRSTASSSASLRSGGIRRTSLANPTPRSAVGTRRSAPDLGRDVPGHPCCDRRRGQALRSGRLRSRRRRAATRRPVREGGGTICGAGKRTRCGLFLPVPARTLLRIGSSRLLRP